MAVTAYIEIEEGFHILCEVPQDLAIHEGDMCVIEADKVQEYGRVNKLEQDVIHPAGSHMGRVVRCATLQDQAKAKENIVMNKMAVETCTAKAEKLKLEMRLVRVRYSFDRAVLVVTFTAEDRVDFRDLVKELAEEMHMRIEMKQIGVRDEAGIIGGMGLCGRAMCCCQWLHHFESINAKAAKVQRLSMNPAAISGVCGRLKCCLRFEYHQYKKMGENIPRDGARVECPAGKGCVLSANILTQRVKVRLDDNRIQEYSVEELK